MIDINSLPKPTVLKELNYEEILSANISNLEKLLPGWNPLESDEYKMIVEAFSYRELHLRTEFNILAKAFFLSTTEGSDLDNYATFYNIERLKGAKPYAIYKFSLSEALGQNIIVPKNLVLSDVNSLFESKLLTDVTILSGNVDAYGLVELQEETASSTIKTEVITTSLPFILNAEATEDFSNGSTPESDEEFKQRILLSMSDKSTAGSEETYKSFTFSADERIKDVKVLNGGPGVVSVYYYSDNMDELMRSRIIENLSQEDVRPLTDNVIVSEAEVRNYIINADLKIYPNQETAEIYTNAVNSLEKGLQTLKTIGTKITLSEINDFLKVPGVKEVVINFPGENIEILENEIGVCNEKSITYTII